VSADKHPLVSRLAGIRAKRRLAARFHRTMTELARDERSSGHPMVGITLAWMMVVGAVALYFIGG
jgi:hypothetical protein